MITKEIIRKAIEEIGLKKFKETSFFISNWNKIGTVSS